MTKLFSFSVINNPSDLHILRSDSIENSQKEMCWFLGWNVKETDTGYIGYEISENDSDYVSMDEVIYLTSDNPYKELLTELGWE